MTWALATVGCLLYQFLPDQQAWVIYMIVWITKYGMQGSFGLCFLVTSEYFPTVYRGFVFGVCNVFARLGGLISPQFSAVFFKDTFMLVFGLLSLTVFVGTFFMFETKGKQMPDLPNKLPRR